MLPGLLLCLSLAVAAQTDRVSVYVSAPAREGFVDTTKDIQDSVQDVRRRLAKVKEFQIVDNPETADITLTVVTRGVGSQAYGQRLSYTEYYNNAILTSAPMVSNTFWVAAMMDVAQYRKELVGAYTQQAARSMGAWGRCADQIARDLRSWAVANAEQLKQRRAIRQP